MKKQVTYSFALVVLLCFAGFAIDVSAQLVVGFAYEKENGCGNGTLVGLDHMLDPTGKTGLGAMQKELNRRLTEKYPKSTLNETELFQGYPHFVIVKYQSTNLYDSPPCTFFHHAYGKGNTEQEAMENAVKSVKYWGRCESCVYEVVQKMRYDNDDKLVITLPTKKQ